jgi:hypothetical protein
MKVQTEYIFLCADLGLLRTSYMSFILIRLTVYFYYCFLVMCFRFRYIKQIMQM